MFTPVGMKCTINYNNALVAMATVASNLLSNHSLQGPRESPAPTMAYRRVPPPHEVGRTTATLAQFQFQLKIQLQHQPKRHIGRACSHRTLHDFVGSLRDGAMRPRPLACRAEAGALRPPFACGAGVGAGTGAGALRPPFARPP